MPTNSKGSAEKVGRKVVYTTTNGGHSGASERKPVTLAVLGR